MTSIKVKQYKNLAYIIAGTLCLFLVMVFLMDRRDDPEQMGRVYRKEIKNGVDALSDQDLWIEKSSNEIDSIKLTNKKLMDKNKILQKQIDSIQKIVIGLGKHLRIFNDSDIETMTKNIDSSESNSTTNLVSSKSPFETQFSRNKKVVTPESNVLQNPMDKIEEFVEHKGSSSKSTSTSLSSSLSEAEHKHKSLGDNQKVLRHGIKVVQINSAPNQYDLEENFIFAGTYARAVLLGSVTVSAGISSSSNPKPVLLRIVDYGNLPNHLKGFLRDAVVIGAAYGNLSSESVVIRLERIIKIDKSKSIGIDIPVKGYVAGENGDSEIRGMVFDRAGAVARTAAMVGFLKGISDYLSSDRSSITFEPNSGLAQFSPQKGAKMLEQGASQGIGEAVSKYADFVIKRAEQMQPVIKLDGGRKLTIVFTESVKASSVNMKKVRRRLYESK